MTAPKLAVAVRAAVADWKQATTLDQRTTALAFPAELGRALGSAVANKLESAGEDLTAIRQDAISAPFVLLAGVFEPRAMLIK